MLRCKNKNTFQDIEFGLKAHSSTQQQDTTAMAIEQQSLSKYYIVIQRKDHIAQQDAAMMRDEFDLRDVHKRYNTIKSKL